MRAKPDMKPWVNIEQQSKELRRSGTYLRKPMPQRINTTQQTQYNDHTQYSRRSAAPKGLNKCFSTLNPGLASWAMQEYRPVEALQ